MDEVEITYVLYKYSEHVSYWFLTFVFSMRWEHELFYYHFENLINKCRSLYLYIVY